MYENALAYCLRKAGLQVQQQFPIKVFDEDGTIIGEYYADLLVENRLIINVKKLSRALRLSTKAQILGYLRATDIETACRSKFSGLNDFRHIRKYKWADR